MSDKLARTHLYEVSCVWTDPDGPGTVGPRAYRRDHVTTSTGRPVLDGSSDPAFRGDGARWNPELLLVASLSQCHLLSYLHACATAGVTVAAYSDDAEGTMVEDGEGGGRFDHVILRPLVTVAEADMVDRALALHDAAAARCFVASSVNFPVRHEPRVSVQA